MRRFWTIIFGIILISAVCTGQVNFSPNWGKRAVGQGIDPGCKTPLESLLYIYRLLQSEVQKIIDCKRLSNV